VASEKNKLKINNSGMGARGYFARLRAGKRARGEVFTAIPGRGQKMELWQVAPRQRQKRHWLAKNETVSPRPRVTRVRAKVKGSERLLNGKKKTNRRLFVFRFFCRFFCLR
jgi:hypothetical protein